MSKQVPYLRRTVYFLTAATVCGVFAFLLHTNTDIWQNLVGDQADVKASQWFARNYSGKKSVLPMRGIQVKINNQTKGAAATEKPKEDAKEQSEKKSAQVFRHGLPKTFELVDGLSSNLYVYGALWQADRHLVRLITIKVQGYKFTKLSCVLYYSEDLTAPGVFVTPDVKELHTYKSPYTSASVSCPVKPDKLNEAPLFIGLMEFPSSTPKMAFAVENRGVPLSVPQSDYVFEHLDKPVKAEFTVCVPALYQLNNSAQLIEKLEMSRLLGANRFVLYNNSVGTNVDTVLRMYHREFAAGRESLEVVVLPWHLPFENGKPIKIPYFAQQLAIDDCMYRYKRLSKYMVFTDLDEFPYPLRHPNWSALIAERRRLKPKSIGWLFRCSVINKDRPSPALGYEDISLRYGSAILGLTSRDVYVYPANDRPKLIVDPTTIEEMGVHLIWSGGGTTDVLPADLALLLHYRWPIKKCTPQVKETRVVESYGTRFAARLKDIWSKLKGVSLGSKPFQAGDKSSCP